jgi:hypothetical protein
MFSKIVLCATQHTLIAGRWQFGKLVSHQVFQHDAQGIERFGLFLQKYRHIKVYLMVDAVEEDYRLETAPHTSGIARREMVNRKLSQLYRATPYRMAHFINRAPDNRRDDRFIFAALIQPEILQPWVNQLETYQVPLVGIYLLPMVSQYFLRHLKTSTTHLLLIELLSSGLRQTYFHNGQLSISRLSPFTEEAKKSPAHFYAVESEKTKFYLISKRYISRDATLNVLIPEHVQDSHLFCRDIRQTQGTTCNTIDLLKLAQGMRLAPALLQGAPELLHMHMLARGGVPGNLAPPKLKKYHQLNVWRQAINGMSVIVLLFGLCLAAFFFKFDFDSALQSEQIEIATQHQVRLYQQVASDFPLTPLPPLELQTVAELERVIMINGKLPGRAMQVLGTVLNVTPEIEINRLVWLLSNERDPQDVGKRGPETLADAVNVSDTGFLPDSNFLHEVVFLNGEIRNFTGDYRAALESMNRLVERLKRDEAVAQVMILQVPVNVSSHSNLQGSTADELAAQISRAWFKLRLTLKREGVVS